MLRQTLINRQEQKAAGRRPLQPAKVHKMQIHSRYSPICCSGFRPLSQIFSFCMFLRVRPYKRWLFPSPNRPGFTSCCSAYAECPEQSLLPGLWQVFRGSIPTGSSHAENVCSHDTVALRLCGLITCSVRWGWEDARGEVGRVAGGRVAAMRAVRRRHTTLT